MIVDFHSHTRASDGSLTPPELVAMMVARGVQTFSITDHDTLGAYASIGEPAARVIPGIEINTTWRDNDVHILGYGFDLGETPVRALADRNREHRRNRIRRMTERLAASGYPLTFDHVLTESAGGDSLGRPHVAKALVRGGMVRDVETAFRTVLARGGPGYEPSHHVTPQDAIDAIAASGGVPVIAHPGRLRDISIVDDLAEQGLAGIEVFYPSHAPGQVAHYRDLAARYGLVMTAGSDFHDSRWNGRSVGMDVEPEDIAPFLALVAG